MNKKSNFPTRDHQNIFNLILTYLFIFEQHTIDPYRRYGYVYIYIHSNTPTPPTRTHTHTHTYIQTIHRCSHTSIHTYIQTYIHTYTGPYPDQNPGGGGGGDTTFYKHTPPRYRHTLLCTCITRVCFVNSTQVSFGPILSESIENVCWLISQELA